MKRALYLSRSGSFLVSGIVVVPCSGYSQTKRLTCPRKNSKKSSCEQHGRFVMWRNIEKIGSLRRQPLGVMQLEGLAIPKISAILRNCCLWPSGIGGSGAVNSRTHSPKWLLESFPEYEILLNETGTRRTRSENNEKHTDSVSCQRTARSIRLVRLVVSWFWIIGGAKSMSSHHETARWWARFSAR